VREHDDVETRGLETERDPVAGAFRGTSLEHPAVDEDAGTAGVNEMAGAGDCPGAAEECELHGGIVTQRGGRSATMRA